MTRSRSRSRSRSRKIFEGVGAGAGAAELEFVLCTLIYIGYPPIELKGTNYNTEIL